MDPDDIRKIAEGGGYNSKHPRYSELIDQAKRSFTLPEIRIFMECLSSVDVVEIKIAPAVFKANDPERPRKGQIVVELRDYDREFDFSSLPNYSLPFVIMGRYMS